MKLLKKVAVIAIPALRTQVNKPSLLESLCPWEELGETLSADQYTLRNVPDRLAHLKDDPWSDYFDLKQVLPGRSFF